MPSYFQRIVQQIAEARKRKNADSNSTSNPDLDEAQSGSGVVTRKQAKLNLAAEPEEKKKENDENLDEQMDVSTIEEPKKRNEKSDIKESAKDQVEKVEQNETPQNRPDSPVIFNSSTLVAQNDSLEAYVVKSYLKRQLKFQ